MTNKEELKNKYIKSIETKWQDGSAIEYAMSENEIDTTINFFWNEIEQIRKADMERVVEEINKLNCVMLSPNTIIEEELILKTKVLSIIKQDEK